MRKCMQKWIERNLFLTSAEKNLLLIVAERIIKRTTINKLMCKIELIALMSTLDYLTKIEIGVAFLVIGGLMNYKE